MTRNARTTKMISKHIDAELGLAYLDGRLDGARLAKLERHLADCAACQEELRQHQAVHGMLQTTGAAFQPQPGKIPAWGEVHGGKRPFLSQKWLPITAALALLIAFFVISIPILLPDNEFEPVAVGLTQTAVASLTPTPTTEPTRPLVVIVPTDEGSGETAVLPTMTPNPTSAPYVPPTKQSFISQPSLSAQGHLVFYDNKTLLVEIEPNSNNYQDMAPNVSSAIWSPSETQLFYLAEPNPPLYSDCHGIEALGIWQADTNSIVSLNYALPELQNECPIAIKWSIDEKKVYLMDYGFSQLLFIDLEDQTVGKLDFSLPVSFWDIGNERILVQERRGTNIASLDSYNLTGELIWSYPNVPSGAFLGANTGIAGYSQEHDLLVIGGPTASNESYDRTTIYSFDLTDFELIELWTEDIVVYSTYFSLDGFYIGLAVAHENDNGSDFMIVDRNGRSYGTRENSQLLDWRPGGGPVVVQEMDNGQNQLVYWPLDGAAARVFVQPRDFRFVGGAWSPDGRTFVYNALDDSIGASYLYLWQPESGLPQLVQATTSEAASTNFAWMPDSSRVYYNLGNQELWSLTAETAELNLIASVNTPDPP